MSFLKNRRGGAWLKCRRGGALLAVLWLAAALSAIAFAVANTVRTETQRTSNASEGIRTYYLAQGSVERGLLWIDWGARKRYRNPDGTRRYYEESPPTPFVRYDYPSGVAVVEFIPEASRLNVNTASQEELLQLLLAVGANPIQAQTVAQGILSWRAGQQSLQQFLRPTPTFGQQRTSFLETEELLLVNGMTPELFYGTLERDPQGRLYPRGGLRECVSVYSLPGGFDANSAAPGLLVGLGFSPQVASEIVAKRPFKTMEQVTAAAGGNPAVSKLSLARGIIWTVRATARLKLPNGTLSDLARTVAATVTFHRNYEAEDPPYRVLRWREEPWTPTASLPF
jgi:general secretion pathway protein K